MRKFLSLLAETYRQWDANKAPKMGAALSFYTVFSLAPLVILITSLVGMVVERDAARHEIVGQFRTFVGDSGAQTVETILSHVADQKAGWWGTLIGFAVVLIGASGVFGELQDSLNQIWGVSSKRHPVFLLLKERALSFAMILVLGFLMLVSFVLSAAIAVASHYLNAWLPGLNGLWELTNSGLSVLVVTVLFAIIFKILPDVKIAWKDVWLGAILTALLFVLGKFLLGFYFGRSAVASSYGAAGPLLILLVWVFYTAQIFFFGAEFTRAYAQRYGSHRQPDPVPLPR